MSIESLAEKSDTSVAFVSRLELHPSGSVRLDKIYQVLDVLELPPAEVFGQPALTDAESELWTLIHKLPESERDEKVRAIVRLLE